MGRSQPCQKAGKPYWRRRCFTNNSNKGRVGKCNTNNTYYLKDAPTGDKKLMYECTQMDLIIGP